MIIALVHWRIRPEADHVVAFLKFWQETATINDRRELVGEFLTEVKGPSDFPYITWHLDPDSLGNHKSFVNVAFWNTAEAFHEQVAKNFNDEKPMLPFEMLRRRRLILSPETWRRGLVQLPENDFPANVK